MDAINEIKEKILRLVYDELYGNNSNQQELISYLTSVDMSRNAKQTISLINLLEKMGKYWESDIGLDDATYIYKGLVNVLAGTQVINQIIEAEEDSLDLGININEEGLLDYTYRPQMDLLDLKQDAITYCGNKLGEMQQRHDGEFSEDLDDSTLIDYIDYSSEEDNMKCFKAIQDLTERFIYDEYGIMGRIVNSLSIDIEEYDEYVSYSDELKKLQWMPLGVLSVLDRESIDRFEDMCDDINGIYPEETPKEEMYYHLVDVLNKNLKIASDMIIARELPGHELEKTCGKTLTPMQIERANEFVERKVEQKKNSAINNCAKWLLKYLEIKDTQPNTSLRKIINDIAQKYHLYSNTTPDEYLNAAKELNGRFAGLINTSSKQERKELLDIKRNIDRICRGNPLSSLNMAYDYNVDREQSCYHKLREWNEAEYVVRNNFLNDKFMMNTLNYTDLAQSLYYTIDTMRDRMETGLYQPEANRHCLLNGLINAENGVLEICKEFGMLEQENYQEFSGDTQTQDNSTIGNDDEETL